jgi:hypothetical protein
MGRIVKEAAIARDKLLSAYAPGQTENYKNSSFRILAKILTGHLPNISHKHYCLS